MIDFHIHPEGWGIKPELFSVGNIAIPSYSFFVFLGLAVGFFVYYLLAKSEKALSEKSLYVLLAGLFGGIIGAKIPIWIINFQLIINSFPDLTPFLSGRTITGGLVGGTLSVLYIKKKLNIKGKKGNLFAAPIAIGVMIGRIGCFLAGCCYGKPTDLPWGVNFGDGILRHPTQIYESIFSLILFSFLIFYRKKAKPGYLFFLLINFYFIFRFFEEFIRENQLYLGFTLFQYISIFALVFINIKYLVDLRLKK